jgi:CubicO group peptidase (beta-lactamase class C family)
MLATPDHTGGAPAERGRPARRPRAPALAAVALAALARTAAAQPAPAPAAHPRDPAGALPGDLPGALDSLFAFAGGAAPGCAVGVARRGAAPLVRAYGMADLAHGVPNAPGTVFESGSVAKQFTAAAVLLLARDGRLSLDDDVRRFLPEVPDFGARMTLRHLLTHTSGLREQWNLLAVAGNPPGTQVHAPATVVDLVSRQRALNFAPGAEFLYANTGYTLAAVVVERASGRPFARFTEERLFRPLGMTRTRWRDDFRRVVAGRATAYSPAPPSDAPGGYREDMPFTNVVGNGGLLTTVGDLLRWNAFLDAPDAAPGVPGGRALVDALQTPARLRDGRALPYALGLALDTLGGERAVAHGGSTAGYKTWLGRVPARGVSVAVLCNHGGADAPALGARVAARALDAAPPPPAGPTAEPAADPGRYAGAFWDAGSGALLQTAAADGRLALAEAPTRVLAPAGPDRFRLPDGRTALFVRAGGRVREVRLAAGADTARLAPVPPPDTAAAALAAYAGTYRSAELDLRVTVAVRGGALVWRQPFGVERPLRAAFAGGFTTPLRGGTTVVFSRAPSGRVDGLGVWAAGVRGLRFARE